MGSFRPAPALPRLRVAQARHRGNRIAQRRRQDVRIALADQDQRLAALLQPAHVDDERLDRAERHLIADLLDGFGRVVRVVLFEVVLRRVVPFPAAELLDRPGDDRVVARHAHLVDRLERVHHADHVRRPELRFDPARDRRARRQARALFDVIVVEKDREQPHVVFRGFRGFVVVVADRPRRPVGGRHRAAVELHELERLDVLRLAVLGDLEIGLFQIGDRVAVAIADDHVDAHEVDPGAERPGLAGG